LEKEADRSRLVLLNRTRQKDELIEMLNKRLEAALQSEKRLQKAEEKITLLEGEEMLFKLRSQIGLQFGRLKNANVRVSRAEAYAARQKKLAENFNVKSKQFESQLVMLRSEQGALAIALKGALSVQDNSCEKRNV